MSRQVARDEVPAHRSVQVLRSGRSGQKVRPPHVGTAPRPATCFAPFADPLPPVASGTTLKRYRLSPGAAPSLTAQTTLNGTAVGLVIDGPRAFVATSTSRVQSFSLSGFGLTSAGQRTFTSAVSGVGGDGQRLYVTAGNKLYVLDSGSATLPVLGSVTLPQSTATALAVAGRRVAIANGTVLVVVSVTNPAAPVVQGSVSVGSGTTNLRALGRRVYAVKTGSNYVVDITNPAAPLNVGTHDALEWAKGAVWPKGYGIRVTGTTVQVGEREP